MTSPTSTSATSTPLTPTSESARGRFLWHELHTKDIAKATAFYPAVTGWTVTVSSPAPGMPPYTMFVNGTMPVAGVWQYPSEELAKGAVTCWVPYFGTDDVNATFSEAVSIGAKELMKPTDIPTVGRIAVMTDPENVMIGLMAPSMPIGAEEGPKMGEFSWHDLACLAPEADLDFYSRLFGWKKLEAMDMGKDGFYHLFGRDRFTYGGAFLMHPEQGIPNWMSYVQVPDLDKSMETVRAKGGTIIMGPHEVPGGDRIALCLDDQGVRFALHGKKAG